MHHRGMDAGTVTLRYYMFERNAIIMNNKVKQRDRESVVDIQFVNSLLMDCSTIRRILRDLCNNDYFIGWELFI